jgi:hypothetical protein
LEKKAPKGKPSGLVQHYLGDDEITHDTVALPQQDLPLRPSTARRHPSAHYTEMDDILD